MERIDMDNKIQTSLWGAGVELDVYFEQLDYDEPTEVQLDAFARVDEVWAQVDAAVPHIIDYVRDEAANLGNSVEENGVFELVHPTTLFIAESEQRVVAILCEFDYDPEHGLAVVFENERFKEVGAQDIVL